MTRGAGEWLANATVNQLVVTALILVGLLAGGIAAGLKWRHDRRRR